MMRSVAVVLFLVLPYVCAWGPIGHEVTASVAQPLLSGAALKGVNDLLNGQTLTDVAVWADTVKNSPQYAWSKTLHYIDVPDWVCNYKHSRDCANEICVTGAIYNFTKVLADTNQDPAIRTDALKFLVHFIGDVHQPLHVGFTSDYGGNTLKGTFQGQSYNLHAVWDTALIKTHVKNDYSSQTAYAQWLSSQVSGPWKSKAAVWGTCTSGPVCADDWASETAVLACTQAYVDANGNKIANGFSLDKSYLAFNQAIIDQQMAAGGVRLASVLNAVFANLDMVVPMEDVVTFAAPLASNVQ